MKSSMELLGDRFFGGQKHQRHLAFARAKNFRDLGGYPTASGKTVRWGVLYRSDSLHKLSEKDLRLLASLNLSRVFDFRSELEAKHEPDRLPEGVRLISLPMLDSSTKVWHEHRGETVKKLRDINPADFMFATNTELVTKFTPEYKRFFHELMVSNGSPILFHCAAGKDRTGFAAAVLLKILGASSDVILKDYLLTNQYLLDTYEWNLLIGTFLKGKRFTDNIRGFMKADETYLASAFGAIEKTHASFENYVRDGLGLSEQDIDKLKKYYLE